MVMMRLQYRVTEAAIAEVYDPSQSDPTINYRRRKGYSGLKGVWSGQREFGGRERVGM